jgi:GTP-binding protein EngB required for normal cell division
MNEIKLIEIREKTKKLQEEAIELFINNDDLEIKERLEATLKEVMEEKRIVITFIGQYSAGKSSIVSALTNRNDIKIDADIATSSATEYILDDQIILVDTPGLYTGNQEHDDITLEAINKSDMLVYCITNELFDSITIKDYKKWVYEKNYRNKMLLVINKMSREVGEYENLKENYIESINRALNPYDIQDVTSTFIDAKDYLEGVTYDDEEFIEISRMDDLKNKINKIAAEKGILSKLDTPIKAISNLIDEALKNSLDNKLDRNQLELVNSILSELEDTKSIIRRKMRVTVSENLSIIESYANKKAVQIGSESFEFNEYEFNSLIEKTCLKINDEINEILQEENEYLKNKLEDIYDSNLMKVYVRDVEALITSGKSDITDLNRIEKSKNIFKIFNSFDISGAVSKHSIKLGATSSQASGTELHKFVKFVGEKINYKFAPWQAVNIAKNIGKVLGVVGIALQVFSVVANATDDGEEKAYREIQKARRSFKENIDEVLSGLEREYNNMIDETLKSYGEMISSVKKEKEESLESLDRNNSYINRLEKINEELMKLQVEINTI